MKKELPFFSNGKHFCSSGNIGRIINQDEASMLHLLPLWPCTRSSEKMYSEKCLFLIVTGYFMFHLTVWILFRWFVNTLKSQYCSTEKRWEWWSLTSATCSCYALHSRCVSTPTTSSGCALLTGRHKLILYSDMLFLISCTKFQEV